MRGIPNARDTQEAFSRHLLTSGCSESTVKTWASILGLFGAWCIRHEISPLDATREAVQMYLAEELDRVGRNTVALRLSVLRSFYGWLDDDDHRTHGLKIRPEQLAPRIPFRADEVAALLEACRNDRDRVMMILALKWGVRIDELVGLTDKDVRLKDNVVLVRGKGSKQRLLPLNDELKALLQPYLGNGALWRMQDGRPMTKKRAQRNMEEIAKRAGVHGHWHRFRTTFGNNMFKAGVPLETVQRLMGHARMDTTAHYAGYSIAEGTLETMRKVM